MHLRLSRTTLSRPQRLRSFVVASALAANPASLLSQQAWEAAKTAAVATKFPRQLQVEEFLTRGGLLNGGAEAGSSTPPHILDVRAPCEFAKGHIPGAVNVPLFSDDERAEVGTLYKRNGHDSAVKRGLQIVERKGWERLLEGAPSLREGDEVLLYCFRGGMRSGGMAWLLSQAPLHVHTLQGGYKRFRNYMLEAWSEARPICVVGGPTGSGKTDVLHALRDHLDAQVLPWAAPARNGCHVLPPMPPIASEGLSRRSLISRPLIATDHH